MLIFSRDNLQQGDKTSTKWQTLGKGENLISRVTCFWIHMYSFQQQQQNHKAYTETGEYGLFKRKKNQQKLFLKKDLMVEKLDRLENSCLKDVQRTKGRYRESRESDR